jgi:quercetin dioxygenase-like cupin family protein
MSDFPAENTCPQSEPPSLDSLERAFPLLAALAVPGLFGFETTEPFRQTAPSHWNTPGWEPFFPGVERRWIYQVDIDGPAAALIRFQPGSRVPLHEHLGFEHILVLSGSQTDEAGLTVAGTLIVNPPGSRHSIVSQAGCVVLAIYDRPVRFLDLPRSAHRSP